VCDACGAMGPSDEQAADPHCDVDAAYMAWNRRACAAKEETTQIIRWLKWQAEQAFNADMREEAAKIDRAAELLALAGGFNA